MLGVVGRAGGPVDGWAGCGQDVTAARGPAACRRAVSKTVRRVGAPCVVWGRMGRMLWCWWLGLGLGCLAGGGLVRCEDQEGVGGGQELEVGVGGVQQIQKGAGGV